MAADWVWAGRNGAVHSGQWLTRSVWRPVFLPPSCRRSHGLENSPTPLRYPPTKRSNASGRGDRTGERLVSRGICRCVSSRYVLRRNQIAIRHNVVASRPAAESAGHELVVSRLQIRRQRCHIALPFGVADRRQNAAQVAVLVRMRREITAEVGL